MFLSLWSLKHFALRNYFYSVLWRSFIYDYHFRFRVCLDVHHEFTVQDETDFIDCGE